MALKFEDVMTQVADFTSEQLARDYMARAVNRWLVLGDEGHYWVTSYRYAQWLKNAGYTLVEE